MHQSKQLFDLAKKIIPGGVNSPVRAFHGVDGSPLFIKSGKGAYLFDEDENKYIDYVGSWGPLLLGHAHPIVIEKIIDALQSGLSFGAPTEIEIKLAQKICDLMPNIEMIRFVNSGTEAAMSAIRLARGFTGRNKIIKFSGCYHGHADCLLVASGSGALTLGVPNSAGIPADVAAHTLVAEYNHLEEVDAMFARYGEDIAAIIVEPVAANMNCILPKPGFLKGLRELCDKHNSLLIFDEVITGFRLGLKGAQGYFNIKPDLTILGKIIGGGFPVGAFGGREEIMRHIAPLGPVYQAGTLSGNPIAMTAGLATLDLISAENFYPRILKLNEELNRGLMAAAKNAGIPFHAVHIGCLFGLFFTKAKHIDSEGEVKRCDLSAFKHFFHKMLKKGIYFAPSAFEVGFLSSAHTEFEITKTVAAAEEVFTQMAEAQRKNAQGMQLSF